MVNVIKHVPNGASLSCQKSSAERRFSYPSMNGILPMTTEDFIAELLKVKRMHIE